MLVNVWKRGGATPDEVIAAVENGEQIPAKFGRTCFRRNFQFNQRWRGEFYRTKQIEVYAVREDSEWVVITVITRYF